MEPSTGSLFREDGIRLLRGGSDRGRERLPGLGDDRRGVFPVKEPLGPRLEGGCRLPERDREPLDRHEFVGNAGLVLRGGIYRHRQDKHDVIGHVMGPVDCELPLPPEVALLARVGVGRDNRHEEPAFPDLPADLLVPGVASPQLALVVPDIEAGDGKGVAEGPGSLAVLRRVADENGGLGLSGRHGAEGFRAAPPESRHTRRGRLLKGPVESRTRPAISRAWIFAAVRADK